jgi:magnesium transporter
VPYDKAIEVFESLDPDDQKDILLTLSDGRVKELLNEMAPDERTELFEELPAELVKKLMNLLSAEERAVAADLLGYPEDSVGRLITPEFLQLYERMTVSNALQHIRKVGLDTETVYHCYVLDSYKRLVGVISLKRLVLAQPQSKIGNLIDRDKEIIKVNVYTDREKAAFIFKKYDLIALPVVDNADKLLGIVTFDDFVDVLEDEATEDFERIAGVLPVDKPYMEAGFFELVWKRSFWLIILLIFESMSSFVIKNYSDSIYRMVALTFFLPVLVGAGGNAGTQSATVIIRALALGKIRAGQFMRVVFKEARLGVFIGIIMAGCGLFRAFLQEGDWVLSMVVGISMGLTILLSTTVGAFLPLVFKRLNWDPALMSAPLITAIIDVVGIALYFEIANLLFGFS